MTDLPFVLEAELPEDAEAILRLNDRVFGPGRFARTAYRLRELTPPDLSLSFVAWVGSLLVGANAMTPIFVGDHPAYLLGPLIVEPVFRSQGIGEALVNRSLDRPAKRAHGSRYWSATSPIMDGWAFKSPLRDGSRCRGRSTLREFFIASFSPALLRVYPARCAGPNGALSGSVLQKIRCCEVSASSLLSDIVITREFTGA